MKVIGNYPVKHASVFESTAYGDDVVGSDLDLLIDLMPRLTMLHIGGMKIKLKALLQVPVDVITIDAIHESFRDRVIQEEMSIESFYCI